MRIEGRQLEVEMKMDDVETLRRRLGDTENPAEEKRNEKRKVKQSERREQGIGEELDID